MMIQIQFSSPEVGNCASSLRNAVTNLKKKIIVLFGFTFGLTAANEPLKCWRCTTDTSKGEFCDDPFDPSAITEKLRYWSYVNCSSFMNPRAINAKPACKKLVQEGKFRSHKLLSYLHLVSNRNKVIDKIIRCTLLYCEMVLLY